MAEVCPVPRQLEQLALPAYVGGNYNDNANYGFFYFNANNSASNTNGNLGSRNLFIVWNINQLHG